MSEVQQITLNFGFEPAPQEPPKKAVEMPVIVIMQDEKQVSFEPPKKRGRKKREKKWEPVNPGKRGRKSFKEIAAQVDLIEIPEDEILFQKQYYSMGDVCDMFKMNQSHIRIWTREFEKYFGLKKNKKGDRFFRPEDVKTVHLIYHLLRQRKYTMDGAKEYMRQKKGKVEEQFNVVQSMQKLKSFLLELKANL